MKAYKIELLVIDDEKVGREEIVEMIQNTKYPNYCIAPKVMKINEAEIGEFHDDHPLNKNDKIHDEYLRLFKD